MATNYIYTLTTHLLPTYNDVTLLSNAPGYTDWGQVVIGDQWSSSRKYYTCAIDLQGGSARLTVGGNFNLNPDGSPVTGFIEDGNIYNPFNEDENKLPLNANVYYKGYNIRDDAAAIRFRESGVLFLSAHTGTKTADQYLDDGTRKSDDNIRIIAEGVTRRNYLIDADRFRVVPPPIPNNTTITAIEVGGDLTVGGDLSGEIGASADSYLHAIWVWSSDKYVQTDTTANQVNVATAIKTGNLVINNNQRGNLHAEAQVDMKAYTKPSITSNTLGAYGINASGSVTCANGQWAGEITTVNSGNLLVTLVNDIIVVAGATERVTNPGTMTGNEIASIGLNAGGDVAITEMIGTNWSNGYNIHADASANRLELENRAPNTDTVSAMTFSNNTIDAYAIKAAGITIGSMSSDVVLRTTSNSNLFSGYNMGGKTPTTDVFNNHIESTTIKADSLTVNDFQGNLFVTASNNIASYTYHPSFGIDFTFSGNYLSANGIRIAETLTAQNNFGGSITVDANNNNLNLFSYCEAYGIKSKTFIVVGRIDSEINVTSSNNTLTGLPANVFNATGIGVTNLVADAFSGSITSISMRGMATHVGIGMYADESFKSRIAGDAFDINGSITASYAGVMSMDTINLRVSGAISSPVYAIQAEYRFDSTTNTIWTSSNNNNADQVELSATARITGNIDLNRGENIVVINSGAQMDGALQATLGKMNIKFILDETVQDTRAIVNTGISDISLASPTTIAINLNYAENATYTLFDYNTATDLTNYWVDKQVTFIYKGLTKVVRLDATGHGSCEFVTETGTSTATIWYDNNTKKVFVTTEGVTPPDAFDASTVAAAFSADSKALNLTWEANVLAAAFEVEYTVYDADGNAYGNSIIQRVAGSQTGCVIQGINPGDTVKWRIRTDMDNGSTVTGWSDLIDTITDPQPVGVYVDMSNASTIVLNPDDAGAGITSAIAKFTWEEAASDNALRNYTVEYFESQTEITLTAAEIRAGLTLEEKIAAQFDTRAYNTKIVTSKEVVVSSLTDQSFVYWRVKATDVNGNESAYRLGESFRVYVGDYTKPVFVKLGNKPSATMSYTYDRTNAYDVKIDATFSWNEAYDSQSGVKYYLVEYKAYDEDWVDAKRIIVQRGSTSPSGEYLYNTTTRLDGGLYDYRISAVDYVGNQSESATTGSFGNIDVAPPEGSFTSMGTPTVAVEWDVVTANTPSGEIVVSRKVVSASVTFDWDDSYTDASGVLYQVQFSNSQYFNTDQTYTFESFAELGSSFFIGNNQPTRPVGIFDGMGTVYWRVMATDTAGNDSGVWSGTSSFRFVDPATGIAISHSAAPSVAYNMFTSQTQTDYVYDGWVDYSWSEVDSDLGIAYYDYVYKSKDGGDNFTRRVSYGGVTPDDPTSTTPGVSDIYGSYLFNDGTYTWQIITYNAKGKSTKGPTASFVVDATRPDTVGALDSAALVHDAYIVWDESHDQFGIKGYEVQYRIKGGADTSWNAANLTLLTENETIITGLGDGTYEYIVYAFDANGNRSLVSETKEFTIDSSKDLADTLGKARVYNGAFENTIGMGDVADCFYFAAPTSGELTLSLSNIDSLFGSGAGKGIVVTVYNVDPKSSTGLKVAKKYTVTKDSDFKLMLERGYNGYYYVAVTAVNRNDITDYDLSMNYDQFPSNNLDDDWKTMDTDIYSLAAPGGTLSDWVGFGDKIDYRKLDIATPGAFNFELSELTNAAKLTIYMVVTNSKGVESLKQLKSITVKPKTDKLGVVTNSGILAGILLDSKNQYYLQIDGTGAAKGLNTFYEVNIDGTVFADANQADDDYWNNLAHPAPALICQPGGGFAGEWVGFGDTWDYRKLELTDSGSYNFTVSELDNAAKVTIYEVVTNSKGVQSLKQLKSITVKPKTDKLGIVTNSGTIAGILLDSSKEYYLQVQATGAAKALNTDYDIGITGTVFDNQYNHVANNTWDAAEVGTLDLAAGITGDWVGFGDAADWFKFSIADGENGAYGFNLELDVQKAAKLTLYSVDANGKLKTVKLGSNGVANLAAGDYALLVASADKGKGKQNTGYDLTVDLPDLGVFALDNQLAGLGAVDAAGAWQEKQNQGMLA